MNPSFNLVDQPWVPCIRKDGRQAEFSLQEVLCQAHELREVCGTSPLMTAALYRLLLAVLHRIFGPSGTASWKSLWKAGQWDTAKIEQYLETWRGRFDLFDPERPFYQRTDPRVKAKSVASIIHEVASGNNATLFDHHTEQTGPTLSPAQAARFLVTAQTFSLAGLSGLPEKFTDSACARGAIFLVEGNNLFETLALNLMRYSANSPIPSRPEDRPAWEMDDPYSPNRTIPLGYLDYLTWQSRRILLVPEQDGQETVIRQMTLAPGLKLDASVLDPMKHYRMDKERGALPLRFTEWKSLWRDSIALFELSSVEVHAPQVLHWLANLIDDDILPQTYQYRILSLGMANDQAKVEFFRHERMPLPLTYLEKPALVESLRDALAIAEEAGKQIWAASSTMASLLLYPEKDTEESRKSLGREAKENIGAVVQHWGVEQQYWSELELPFSRLVVSLAQQDLGSIDAWRTKVKRTARRAFKQAENYAGQETRSWKAIVLANKQLDKGLSRIFASPN